MAFKAVEIDRKMSSNRQYSYKSYSKTNEDDNVTSIESFKSPEFDYVSDLIDLDSPSPSSITYNKSFTVAENYVKYKTSQTKGMDRPYAKMTDLSMRDCESHNNAYLSKIYAESPSAESRNCHLQEFNVDFSSIISLANMLCCTSMAVIQSVSKSSERIVLCSSFRENLIPEEIIETMKCIRTLGSEGEIVYYRNMKASGIVPNHFAVDFCIEVRIYVEGKRVGELTLMNATTPDSLIMDHVLESLKLVSSCTSQMYQLWKENELLKSGFESLCSKSIEDLKLTNSSSKHNIRTSLSSLSLALDCIMLESNSLPDLSAINTAINSCTELQTAFESNVEKSSDTKVYNIKHSKKGLTTGSDMETQNGSLVSSSRPISVLLVEDSVSIQKMLSKYLSRKNCVVEVASDGSEGYDLMTKMHFDLLITDFMMPHVDGVEMLRRYSYWLSNRPTRENTTNMESPYLIIGMSATANQLDIDQAQRYGMEIFMTKPFNHQCLDENIQIVQKRKNVKERSDSFKL